MTGRTEPCLAAAAPEGSLSHGLNGIASREAEAAIQQAADVTRMLQLARMSMSPGDRSAGPAPASESLAGERAPRPILDAETADVSEAVAESHKSLPADFRVQLHILECVAQQGRLLQTLTENQQQASLQLSCLQRSAARQQEHMQEHMHRQTKHQQTIHVQQQKLEEQVQQRSDEMFDKLDHCHTDLHKLHGQHHTRAAKSAGLKDCEDHLEGNQPSAEKRVLKQSVTWEVDSKGQDKQFKKQSFTDMLEEEEREANGVSDPLNGEEDDDIAFKQQPLGVRIVTSPKFDLVTGSVIMANAFIIGYSAEIQVRWAIGHPGEGEQTPSEAIRYLGYFFVFFYMMELFLKLAVFKLGFFCNLDYKWNIFDLVLVIVAAYDMLTEFVDMGDSVEVTWLRLLRLMKMMKMLRVVRVMRCFKELRTMMSSLIGSVSSLCWSIVMVFLITYIFGLVFLQAVSGYLNDTSPDNVDKEHYDLIRVYWCSVPQACLTLYFAVSGGADWEPLGQPLKSAGLVYYFLFLFFITFSTIAVLNIVTGLFVDNAMKVVDVDESNVTEMKAELKEVLQYKAFLKAHGSESHTVHYKIFADSIHSDITGAFFRSLEINADDAHRVFKMLEHADRVFIDDFVDGCMKVKEDIKGIDMVSLKADIKRCFHHISLLVEALCETEALPPAHFNNPTYNPDL